MKNNNKFRLDVWGAITLGTIALYALFLLYPMAYLIRQSVLDPDTGGFTLAYFTKFFSRLERLASSTRAFGPPSIFSNGICRLMLFKVASISSNMVCASCLRCSAFFTAGERS